MTQVADQVARLSAEEKRRLLKELLRKKAGAAESFPLSVGQRALWLAQQQAPEDPSYHLVLTIEVAAWLDEPLARKVTQQLAATHPMLRARFVMQDNIPCQQIATLGEIPVRQIEVGTDEECRQTIEREADRPFDLQHEPPIRVTLVRQASGRCHYVLVIHHLVADFHSAAQLLRDVAGILVGEVDDTRAPRATFEEFVAAEQTLLESEAGVRLKSFWLEQLKELPPPVCFPADREAPAGTSPQGAGHWFEVDRDLTAGLRSAAGAEQATLFMLVVAALQTLLHRYSGADDVVIGTPLLARPDARFNEVVGYFSNALPLRMTFGPQDHFREVLLRARETVCAAIEHQQLPLPALVDALAAERGRAPAPLFRVLVAWEKLELMNLDALSGELRGMAESLHLEQRGAPFEIMLQVFESADSLRICLRYDARRYDAATIKRLADHFQVLLAGVATDPSSLVATLPLLTTAELDRQMIAWNNTRRDWSLDECLHELIEAQVKQTPEAPAVTFAGHTISYRELNEQAATIASALVEHGAGRDQTVAVALERSRELLPVVLGVLKAGAAYLPLDPHDPPERLRDLLADAGARILISTTTLPAVGVAEGIEIFPNLRLTIVSPALTAEQLHATPESLAYVIYTSGSTGQPKGVMIEHRGIVNRLRWMQEAYALTSEDCVLHKTPLTFDVSVWELFWPLITGARLVVARPGGHREPDYLARLIAEEQVTTVHFVPTLLRAFVEQPELPGLTSLKRVIASGEALPAELVERFYERSSAELHNLYGPTEASIDVTAYTCPRGTVPANVPIGRPVANTQTYILDRNRQLLPIGLPGELFLGGVQLARGYVNRPELTAERFIAHPFSSEPDARLYRTGDLTRFLPDGNIEFLGRIDSQVKLSGRRIEPGEIEAVLVAHPQLREVAVVVRNEQLVAYVTPRDRATPTLTELREFAAARLPQHMLPSAVVSLESLPLTTSGKLDRSKLPAPVRSRGELSTPYVAPRTPTEQTLCEALATTLAIDRVGVEDNFFELGGASNQALELIARANAAGLPVSAETVFRHPTVARLAAECDRQLSLRGNVVVESLGVYLPERVLSTDEVMRGCRRKIDFPLEELTGIRQRHVVGDGEYAIDLAQRAAEACFARSRYQPDDVDLVISCAISRIDAPHHAATFEPSTAIRLCARLGISDAIAFDISNACAGMFTGISLAETLLKLGLVDRALVVSGEYISHLTETAQDEIEDNFDARLPCLTVGDAGAAVLLERTADKQTGFHEIDLCTHTQYSRYCVAKASYTGAIMVTDVLGVSNVVTQEGVAHWAATGRRHGWTLSDVQHLIPHQVSQTTVLNGFNEARKLGDLSGRENMVISNVALRANTATTSHWVAVWDHATSGRIQPNDNIVFGVSGSGITIGTALYSLGDLPERLRAEPQKPPRAPRVSRRRADDRAGGSQRPRVAIASVAIAVPTADEQPLALTLARRAAESCFAKAGCTPTDVELLIYSGVYREEMISEPALATMLAEDLQIGVGRMENRKRFFAFDLFNGSIGTLQAIYLAIQRIRARRTTSALVVAADIDNNTGCTQEPPLGVVDAGSALLLRPSSHGRGGFGDFVFRNQLQHVDKRYTHVIGHNQLPYIHHQQDAELERHYLDALEQVVAELKERANLSWPEIRYVVAPQISPGFAAALGARLRIGEDQLLNIATEGYDLFTSSLAFGLAHLEQHRRTRAGDICLLLAVGAGVQAGGCIYYCQEGI